MDPFSPGDGEPSLKYGPSLVWDLTPVFLGGHRVAGSLTGVVASKRVTEASQGALKAIGNRLPSAMAEGRLTARPTSRAGAKAGHSDPVVPAWNGEGPKGSAVRRLKWHASWVQNVVRQFGPYLSRALEV